MSSLKGRSVRIIISTIFPWNKKNLFGTIIKAQGDQNITIKLSKPISRIFFSNDLLEISPTDTNGSFRPIEQYYAVAFQGWLLDEKHHKSKHTFKGIITFD